jgi:hypothetical protein
VRNGGNEKLRSFLEQYNLENEDIKVKYNTKAADFYRKRLGALAN